MVEEALPHVAFEGRGGRSVAVEVAEPFAVFRVCEVLEGPCTQLLVPFEVTGLAREPPRHHCCDECLVMRPPEFHFVPVFLHRPVKDIAKVKDPSLLRVPAAPPHPLKHAAAKLDHA